jgi:hypothetical protein
VSSLSVSRSFFSALSCLAVLLPAAAAWGQGTALPPRVLTLDQPIRLGARDVLNVHVTLEGLEPGVVYRASLPPETPGRDVVTLGFLNGAPERPRPGGTPLEGLREGVARQDRGLDLRITAGRCCEGPVDRTVRLLPQGRAGRPVELPLTIVVQPDAWACRRGLQSLLVGLLGGLLTVYAYGMVVQSHFLSPRDLASRLEALLWDESGELKEHSPHDVAALVQGHLTPWRRAWAWLRANPLAFGLPGGAYHETVELDLQPRRDVFKSSLTLVPERAFHRRMEEQPGRAEGRLFATALGGTRFFAVPLRGRVGRLVLERLRDRDHPRQVVWLEPRETLLREVGPGEARSGVAGWQIQGKGKPR